MRLFYTRFTQAGDCLPFFAVLIAATVFASRAEALILKTWNGSGTPAVLNDSAPGGGAAIDDPGWANTGSTRSAIYLGDQWVLTANHVSTGDIVLPGGTYSPIPGTEVILTNPSTFGTKQQGNGTLSSNADLKLYRINTHPTSGLTPEQQDPDVRDIEIATSRASVDTELLMIGAGKHRAIAPSDPNGQKHWNTLSPLSEGGQSSPKHGFFVEGVLPNRVKAWGTNRVSAASGVPNAYDSGGAVLAELGGSNNDVISLAIKFDRGLTYNTGLGDFVDVADGSTDDEAQASGGDSGGPVFYRDGGGDWVLGGVMHAIYLENNQPTFVSVFGNHTVFSDLSFTHYYDQIATLRASDLYSVIGDVDLDGVVTGEIIGGVPTGDLAALVDGWLYNQAEGDIISWKEGDLNQDGFTNLADFVILRDALGGTISTSAFSLLVSGVPEPSTALLTLLGMATLASRRRQ